MAPSFVSVSKHLCNTFLYIYINSAYHSLSTSGGLMFLRAFSD